MAGCGDRAPTTVQRDRGPDPDEAAIRRTRRRVVVWGPIGAQDGEVGLAAESVVERGEQVGGRLVRSPGVLEPASPDLGVGSTVDPALASEPGAQALVVAEIAVMAEREPPARVVERLGVRLGQGREPGRTPQDR